MFVEITSGRIYGKVDNSGTIVQFTEINPSTTFDGGALGTLIDCGTLKLQVDHLLTEKSLVILEGQDAFVDVVVNVTKDANDNLVLTKKRLRFLNGILGEYGDPT